MVVALLENGHFKIPIDWCKIPMVDTRRPNPTYPKPFYEALDPTSTYGDLISESCAERCTESCVRLRASEEVWGFGFRGLGFRG